MQNLKKNLQHLAEILVSLESNPTFGNIICNNEEFINEEALPHLSQIIISARNSKEFAKWICDKPVFKNKENIKYISDIIDGSRGKEEIAKLICSNELFTSPEHISSINTILDFVDKNNSEAIQEFTNLIKNEPQKIIKYSSLNLPTETVQKAVAGQLSVQEDQRLDLIVI